VSSPDEWLALVSWRNAVLAAAGVCAGAWWSAGDITRPVVFAALAAIALTAVANTSNDLADIEIDRVAHPKRPLPSGAISPSSAKRVAIVCAVAALALTVLVDPWLAVLTVAVVAIMWSYSAQLKRYGIPGNIAVAVLGSLPFLYGAWAVDERDKGALLVMVAAPLHFAREVAKDLDDTSADAGTRRTLPIASGIGAARAAFVGGVVAYSVAVALLARAYPLFATLLVPTIFLAGLATRRLYLGRDGSASLLKAAMVVAIVALLVSGCSCS
jgi:geranylgeranylglycerol-phosphate geranylgeranyltransferase